jgi:hypothetical protein
MAGRLAAAGHACGNSATLASCPAGGDVHTVVVNGRVVKYDSRLVGIGLDKARRATEETTGCLKRELGDQARQEPQQCGLSPPVPPVLPTPLVTSAT